jgi:uncharacterized integral membrane protein
MISMQELWSKLSLAGKLRFVLTLIVGIIGVVFATLNWTEQEVHLIFAVKKVPLSLLIVISIASGYAICSLIKARVIRGKDDEIKRLKEKLPDEKDAQ